MFQPTTECVDSLTVDDVTGQPVPESGTGRSECSFVDSCKPHSRYLQSMCPRWSEPMPARHVSYAVYHHHHHHQPGLVSTEQQKINHRLRGTAVRVTEHFNGRCQMLTHSPYSNAVDLLIYKHQNVHMWLHLPHLLTHKIWLESVHGGLL